jgi:hypothetical protein
MWHKLAVIVLAASVALGTSQTVAQDKAPKIFPAAPPPSECVVEPVGDDKLIQPSGSTQATPLATPAEPASPLSMFPNSESVESPARKEIEALERQFAACWNGGEWRRMAALFTDEYLARIVAASGDRVQEFYPPEPEPFDRLDWHSYDVIDVRRIEEGRLVSMVDFCAVKQIHYYRRDEQGWRIDDSIDLPIEGLVLCSYLPPGTPAPGS